MAHYGDDMLAAYIKDKLSEEKRVEIEDHLFSCNECLDVYMQQMDAGADQLPSLENHSSFTDEVIESLSFSKPAMKIPTRKRRIYQHSLFHYGVAAGVTLVLMTSGFFQGITGIVSNVEAASNSPTQQTVSKNVMEKALSFIDMIEPKQKEGETNE